MPAAVRRSDTCTGHGCYGPRPAVQGSTNVFTNRLAQHRSSDMWAAHCCGIPCHNGVAAAGSPNVFVNGLQAERVGDPVNCGSSMATGSPNVFING